MKHTNLSFGLLSSKADPEKTKTILQGNNNNNKNRQFFECFYDQSIKKIYDNSVKLL